MSKLDDEAVRRAVRENYGAIAKEARAGCCEPEDCCGGAKGRDARDISAALGYSAQEMGAAPAGSNMGLGCGNPQAIAALKAGETVLDLGSGGGFDAFLAAQAVGPAGRVIGVDMTADMVSKARANAAAAGVTNVEFRLGEIEHLPVADGAVDAIISNCVINLSPDKPQVFEEAFRVLRPGGRLAISDVVALAPLPEEIKAEIALISGCVAGAAQVEELRGMLAAAGFVDIAIEVNPKSAEFIRSWLPDKGIEKYVAAASIKARKP